VRILCLADYYLPGHRAGGPVRSLSALVQGLAGEVEFSILTRDRDLQADHPYPGVATSTWVPVGHARVWYAPPHRARAEVLELLRNEPYDLLYLNSFFSPTFSVLPMLARRIGASPQRPVLVAPRGELASAALALGARRKQAYMWLARTLGVYHGAWFHAATEQERQCIRGALRLPTDAIGVAANASLPEPEAEADAAHHPAQQATPREQGPLRAIFMSRISPIKNLELIIDALHGVTSPVELHVYGPIHDAAYWHACQRRATTLPANVSLAYHGPVPHEHVTRIFARHDVFLFPSRSESFGHVIGESLRAGTAVVTSPHTPWQPDGSSALEVLPIEGPQAWTQAIEQRARLGEAALSQTRRAAWAYARAHRDAPAHALKAMRALLEDARRAGTTR
jgi:glycosyltransferase involved in cell wall biosynthesis